MNPADIHDYLLGLVCAAQKRGQCPPDGIDDRALRWLLEEKARSACAFWEFNLATNTLRAADPGRPTPLVFVNTSPLAFQVGELLRLPRWPQLVGIGSRRAVNTALARIETKLKARQQHVLAEALGAIHLEQDGVYVRGVYDPEGLDIRVKP